MNERYPYLRLITDAGNILAGLIAFLVIVAGGISGWRMGGVGGSMSFLIAVVLAWIAYLAVMAQIEGMRLLLEIERALGEVARHQREARDDTAIESTTRN